MKPTKKAQRRAAVLAQSLDSATKSESHGWTMRMMSLRWGKRAGMPQTNEEWAGWLAHELTFAR